MNKCIVCGDWLTGKILGVQRYAMQLLFGLDSRLEKGDLPFEIELLIPVNIQWHSPFHNIHVARKGVVQSKWDKHFWQQVTFPFYVRKQKAIGLDLTLALPLWGCDICAIHDCIPERFPENFVDRPFYLKIYLTKVRRAVKIKTRKIVTVSKSSMEDLLHYYNISEDRIAIIPNGWEHMIDIQEDDSIFERKPALKKEKYFLALGSQYKHKNISWIMKAAKGNSQYLFVVTGTDILSNEKRSLMRNKPDNVIFTGFVTDGEMKALIHNCRALIQPSLYEGFGIPPLEALSLGKPIILSNASCLPEIYGNSAHYIDPYGDSVNLDELLSQKTENPKIILSKYSWSKSADLLFKVIQEVMIQR